MMYKRKRETAVCMYIGGRVRRVVSRSGRAGYYGLAGMLGMVCIPWYKEHVVAMKMLDHQLSAS